MRSAFRYGYLQAKLHGKIGASYVRNEIDPLIRAGSAHEVAALLFPGRPYDLPEKALIRTLQADFDAQQTSQISGALRSLSPVPPILIHLLREREYRLVKRFVRGGGSPVPVTAEPQVLGRFGTITPSDGAVTTESLRKTDFAWVPTAMEKEPPQLVESRLDLQYYRILVDLGRNVPGAERPPILEMVKTEALLQNFIWILRQRTYFRTPAEQILPTLIPVTKPFPDRHTRYLLSASLDDAEELRDWKYAWLTTGDDHEASVDPAAAELRAQAHMLRRARRNFYAYPFCLALVYAYIKLKDYEAQRVSTILEGLEMSLSEDELRSAATIM